MRSEFERLSKADADYVRARLLAGDKMASVRNAPRFFGASGRPTISARLMRNLRDELFGMLTVSPDAVKALAAGPLLNSNEIIRYSHSRKTIAEFIANQGDFLES